MCKQMFRVSPARQRSAPSPNPHLHLPLISFASSLLSQASVLRCHVGDTCVPVAALRNSGHLTKWSPLQPDNARGARCSKHLSIGRGEGEREGGRRGSDNVHTWHKLVLKIRRPSTSICLRDCEQMSKLLQTKVIKAETQDGSARHSCFSLRSFSCLAQEQMTNGGGQV